VINFRGEISIKWPTYHEYKLATSTSNNPYTEQILGLFIGIFREAVHSKVINKIADSSVTGPNFLYRLHWETPLKLNYGRRGKVYSSCKILSEFSYNLKKSAQTTNFRN